MTDPIRSDYPIRSDDSIRSDPKTTGGCNSCLGSFMPWTFWEAMYRLYRSRFCKLTLRLLHFKICFNLYKTCKLLHRSKIKNERFKQWFRKMSVNFTEFPKENVAECYARVACLSSICSHTSLGIARIPDDSQRPMTCSRTN